MTSIKNFDAQDDLIGLSPLYPIVTIDLHDRTDDETPLYIKIARKFIYNFSFKISARTISV